MLKCLNIEHDRAKDAVFYQGRGCNNCGGTGYQGRLPVFEFMVVNKDIRAELIAGANEAKLRAMAREMGYGGLLESGVSKVLQGQTSAEEVMRVAFTESS